MLQVKRKVQRGRASGKDRLRKRSAETVHVLLANSSSRVRSMHLRNIDAVPCIPKISLFPPLIMAFVTNDLIRSAVRKLTNNHMFVLLDWNCTAARLEGTPDPPTQE